MLDEAIRELGRRAGLEGLTFTADGVAALELEDLGRLHLERRDSGHGEEAEVLLYLALDLPAHDTTDAAQRILELCHWRHAHPFPLAGGVHAGQAVLLTRLPERRATAAALEEALRFLVDIAPQASNSAQRG